MDSMPPVFMALKYGGREMAGENKYLEGNECRVACSPDASGCCKGGKHAERNKSLL